MTFLHSLIPVWLSDQGKALTLFVDKTCATGYLNTSFIEIVSAVVDVPSPTTSVSIADDLQNYVLRVAIKFLCQCGDKDSLNNVFKFLTCYIYLKKRIQLCDWDDINEIVDLNKDLLLAADCFTAETQERNVLTAIDHVLYDQVNLMKCPNLLLFCIHSSSNVVRESV